AGGGAGFSVSTCTSPARTQAASAASASAGDSPPISRSTAHGVCPSILDSKNPSAGLSALACSSQSGARRGQRRSASVPPALESIQPRASWCSPTFGSLRATRGKPPRLATRSFFGRPGGKLSARAADVASRGEPDRARSDGLPAREQQPLQDRLLGVE